MQIGWNRKKDRNEKNMKETMRRGKKKKGGNEGRKRNFRKML